MGHTLGQQHHTGLRATSCCGTYTGSTTSHWVEGYRLLGQICIFLHLLGFIGQLLMSATAECIRSWVQRSYHAAYLLSNVLAVRGSELEGAKVRDALQPIAEELAESSDNALRTLSKKLSQ